MFFSLKHFNSESKSSRCCKNITFVINFNKNKKKQHKFNEFELINIHCLNN